MGSGWGEHTYAAAAAAARSLQSCLTLCDPIDGSSLGSSVPGILQARILEWVAFPSLMSESEVAQSCLTLSDPMDCSLPSSSVHGISRQEYWSGVPLPCPEHMYTCSQFVLIYGKYLHNIVK